MTETEKLQFYELHGHRPPAVWYFSIFSYKTGLGTSNRKVECTKEEAYTEAQRMVDNAEDEGRILLLYQYFPVSDTVDKEFLMLHKMFWPKAVDEMMQTFFEVL